MRLRASLAQGRGTARILRIIDPPRKLGALLGIWARLYVGTWNIGLKNEMLARILSRWYVLIQSAMSQILVSAR